MPTVSRREKAAGPPLLVVFETGIRAGRGTVALLVCAALFAPTAHALPAGVTQTAPPEGTSVNTYGHTNTLAAGPDGALWLTQGYARIGRLVPCAAGGCSVTQTVVVDSAAQPQTPFAIAAGAGNDLWFTLGGAIGRLEPCATANCPYTETMVPFTPGTSDSAGSIVKGSDGGMWFTDGSKIGRVAPCATGGCTVTLSPLPAGSPPSVQITSGPDGALWFTTANSIGRVAPCGSDGCAITMTPLPQPPPNVGGFAPADGITTGSDGAIWFTQSPQVGRLTPCTTGNCPLTFTKLSNGSNPNGIVAGSDAGLWFVESGTGRIARMAPCAGGGCPYAETAIPFDSTPFSTLGPAGAITSGPDGALWFTAGGNGSKTYVDRIATDAPLIPAGARPGGGTAPTVAAGAASSTTLVRRKTVVDSGQTVTCAAACTASVTGQTTANGQVATAAPPKKRRKPATIVIGTANLSVPAGATKHVTFTLNARGASLLRRLKHLQVKVTVSVRGGGGAPVTASKKIMIRVPRGAGKQHS